MPLKLNEWVIVKSASQTKLIHTDDGYDVYYTLTYYLEAMLTSQNVNTNKSYGKVRTSVTRSGGNTYRSQMTATCLHCTTYSGVANPPATLASGTFELTGNAAGEASLHLSGTLTAAIGDFSISADGWMSAPTIPRKSTPTFSSDPLTIGNTQTITTNRASSDFTHTITLSVGDYTETLENVGASTTWTPSAADLMPYMTSWQMPVTVTTTTYNGTSTVGSTSTSFTLQVDTSVFKPVITVGTKSDTNATTSSLETSGTFIKGYSHLSVPVSVAVNESAYDYEIATLTITLGNTTKNLTVNDEAGATVFTADVLTNSLVVTAVDSLGYTVTQTTTLTVIDYSDIQINSINTYRVNSSDQPTETGEYIHYDIECTAYSGSFGQASNTIVVKSKSKTASSSTYGAEVTEKTVTTSGNGSVQQISITGITTSGSFSSSTQYDIVFVLTDSLGSATSIAYRIHEGVPVFAWGEDHFDVYGDFHIHDRSDVTKYISLSPLNPSTETVTFSGADGGSVTWLVFDFGALTICACKWRSASNVTTGTAWGGMYTSSAFNTPSYPVAYTSVYYQNIQYVQADQNSNMAAIPVVQVGYSADLTSLGQIFLARGGSSTIGHPIFTQIVVGTR